MNLNIKKSFAVAIMAIGCQLALSVPAVKAQSGPAQQTLKPGDKVPDFSLKDQDGKTFDLSTVVGKKKLVIFFYPKDESPVCTTEACAFRDGYEKFNDADAMVIGINHGSSASHKSFATKNHLPFTLLSDPGNAVLHQFGVKEKDFGERGKVSGRETFVIGLDGKVVYSFRDFMNGAEHSSKVLDYLTKK